MSVNSGIVSSKPVSILLGVVFLILAVLHFGVMCWKRSWLMLSLIIGCILEITGYFSSSAGYGSQSVQVIIAPIFLAATVYVSFGDVVSFGLQIAGIVLELIEDNSALGTGIVIAGFVIQLISFSCFLTLIIIIHKRLNKFCGHPVDGGFYIWSNYIKVLYVIIALFFIRNVFRLVEYAIGWGGYLFEHAAFVYAFDGLTMAVATCIMLVVHPAFVYQNITPLPAV